MMCPSYSHQVYAESYLRYHKSPPHFRRNVSALTAVWDECYYISLPLFSLIFNKQILFVCNVFSIGVEHYSVSIGLLILVLDFPSSGIFCYGFREESYMKSFLT